MTNLNQLLTAASQAEVSMKAAKAEYYINRSEKNLTWWKIANAEWNRLWKEIEAA